jgi:hypothetical protein
MASTITWKSGDSNPDLNPDNEANLAQIANWWSTLLGQRIVWKQRPIPTSGNTSDISWEAAEQFDETFLLQNPELKGITLYWGKPDAAEVRNLTPKCLELDLYNQHLYIDPASGKNYQIRVSLPQIVYQNLSLNNPQITSMTKPNGEVVLLLRDQGQRLEIKVDLNQDNVNLLRQKLS